MKKLKSLIRSFLTTCTICYGMGTVEKPNGDTMECVACKGKGYR